MRPDSNDLDKLPLISVDADTENADWIKVGWDFPPYKSAEFLDLIGGPDRLPEFRKTPAYKAAVDRGIIHDDEWLLDWCEPGIAGDEGPEHHEPGELRRRPVHVHVHRGR
jgi:hypothetical protein